MATKSKLKDAKSKATFTGLANWSDPPQGLASNAGKLRNLIVPVIELT